MSEPISYGLLGSGVSLLIIRNRVQKKVSNDIVIVVVIVMHMIAQKIIFLNMQKIM